jgi:hypothetical protein
MTAPVLLDPQEHLTRVLQRPYAGTHPILKYVDLYGDTYLNQLQVSDLLRDWHEVVGSAQSQDERRMLESWRRLLELALERPHQYVCIVGE